MNVDINVIEQLFLFVLKNGWYVIGISLAVGFFIKWTPGLNKISEFIPAINAVIAVFVAYFFKPFQELQLPAQITLSVLLALVTSPFYDKIIKPFETHIVNFIQNWLAKLIGARGKKDGK